MSFLDNSDKTIFGSMIDKTRKCLENQPAGVSHKEKIQCETAIFSDEKTYTYHTHPVGIPTPSEADIKTTRKFKKKYLIIGLVPTRTVVIWGVYPTYDKLIGKFKV